MGDTNAHGNPGPGPRGRVVQEGGEMSIEEQGAARRAALAAEEEFEEKVRLLVLRAVGFTAAMGPGRGPRAEGPRRTPAAPADHGCARTRLELGPDRQGARHLPPGAPPPRGRVRAAPPGHRSGGGPTSGDWRPLGSLVDAPALPERPAPGLRHHDLRRDVGAGRGHGRRQPRAGLSRHRRSAGGDGRGGRRHPRGAQPVPARSGGARAAAKRLPPTSSGSTGSRTTPIPRSW